MLHIYYCWCVDDHSLSPYQTRAKWLSWLLRKSRPFGFFIWAPGALDLHLWSQNGNTFSFLYHHPHMCKVWALSLLQFLKYKGGGKKFALGPLGPLTFVLGAKMEVSIHPCHMPHKCAKFTMPHKCAKFGP